MGFSDSKTIVPCYENKRFTGSRLYAHHFAILPSDERHVLALVLGKKGLAHCLGGKCSSLFRWWEMTAWFRGLAWSWLSWKEEDFQLA